MTIVNANFNQINNPLLHAKKGEQFLIDEKIHNFKSKAMTLDSVLQKYKAPNKIDLLSLDVEGYELEVLKGINFELYSFKFILVETKNFIDTNIYLNSKGYEVIDKLSYHDYLYKLI